MLRRVGRGGCLKVGQEANLGTEHKAATFSSLSRELGWPPMFNGKQGLPETGSPPHLRVEEQVGWGPRLGLPFKVTEQVTRSHGSRMVFVTRNQPLLSYRSLFGASYESKTNTKKESFLLLNFPVFSILVYFPD